MLVFLGYRTDIARYVAEWGIALICLCVKRRHQGGVPHPLGGLLQWLRKYRAIGGIAAILSRTIARYGATKVRRGCRRCFGACGPKACCIGAKQGGLHWSKRLLAQVLGDHVSSWPKHPLRPLLTTWAILRFFDTEYDRAKVPLGSVKTGCIAKKGLSSRTFWWGFSVTRSGGFSYIRREKSTNRSAPTRMFY